MSRKIDALVAERVMGWTLSDRLGMGWPIPDAKTHPVKYPVYSSDISAAWEVVEKMKDRDPVVRRDGSLWMAIMDASDRPDDTETKWHDHRTYTISRRRVSDHADSACEAIAIAALRAVGVPESEIQEAMQ